MRQGRTEHQKLSRKFEQAMADNFLDEIETSLVQQAKVLRVWRAGVMASRRPPTLKTMSRHLGDDKISRTKLKSGNFREIFTTASSSLGLWLRALRNAVEDLALLGYCLAILPRKTATDESP